jgi:DNA-binding MarR family transcriptional regulator
MEQTGRGAGVSDAEELSYVEEVGLFFEGSGLPRMAGRVIGWLLICEPAEQSAAELAAALQASKGSISAATRMLTHLRLIERVSLPGRRRDYFVILPGGWHDLILQRIRLLTAFRRLTERGLGMLSDADPARRERLEDVHELYVWLERELPALFERWARERKGGGG